MWTHEGQSCTRLSRSTSHRETFGAQNLGMRSPHSRNMVLHMHQDKNVRIRADFNVTFHNVVDGSVMGSAGFKNKQNTRATEMFGADS